MKTTELALELAVRRLERQAIARVHYQQLAWTGRPVWPAHSPHSVDVAVVLELDSGKKIRIAWADELGLRHGHGIGVREIAVIDRHHGPVIDVTGIEPWRSRVGQPIATAAVSWLSVADSIRSSLYTLVCLGADHLARADYPQAIQLGVAGSDPVAIGAARIGDDGEVAGFTNNLLVAF